MQLRRRAVVAAAAALAVLFLYSRQQRQDEREPLNCKQVCSSTASDAQTHLPDAASRSQLYERVLIVPDLHGDYEQGLHVLQLLGAVNTEGNWIGGRSLLVQLGDLEDRGHATLKLISWFEDLKVQAHAVGGKVVALLGNHGHLLATEDLRYFSRRELLALGEGDMNKGLMKLKELVGPQGKYGQVLRQRPLAWISTGSEGGQDCSMLLVHAAALPHMIDAAKTVIPNLPAEPEPAELRDQQAGRGWAIVRAWNQGITSALHNEPLVQGQPSWLQGMLLGANGPLWSRAYVALPPRELCAAIQQVRTEMGVSRVVVGHTVQLSGQVSELCGGALLMADVALSREMSSRKLGEVVGLECRASSAAGGQEGVHGSLGGGAGEVLSSEGEQAAKGGGGEAVEGGQCKWVQKGGGGQASGFFSNKDECEGRSTSGVHGELRVWKSDGSGKSLARLLSKPPP